MHGFPDNLHLYDRLVPYLSPPVALWRSISRMGWLGQTVCPCLYVEKSDLGPRRCHRTARVRAGRARGARRIRPAGHRLGARSSHRVAALVLLNTTTAKCQTLRRPEAIWLFSTPLVKDVTRPVSALFDHLLFRRMYWWQVGRFFRDAGVRSVFLPLLYRQFEATPSAHRAFFGLNTTCFQRFGIARKGSWSSETSGDPCGSSSVTTTRT